MASGVSLAILQPRHARHQLLGRQAEHHDLVRRRRVEAAVEPQRAGRHAAPRHVLGEGGEPRQRLLDARHARRHEGAGAVPLHQHAAAHQVLHGLADGDARHVGLLRDVALGGQRVARPDQPVLHRLLDALLEPQVERRARLVGPDGGEDPLGEVDHVGLSTVPKRRTAIRTAPPSASCSGALSMSAVTQRQERRVKLGQPSQRAQPVALAQRQRIERLLDMADGAADELPGERIALVQMLEDQRREGAEVARLGGDRIVDGRPGSAAEPGEHRLGERRRAGGCRHRRGAWLPAGRARAWRRRPGRR